MVERSDGMKCQEFINQHNDKHYCEIVISPTGDIEYAMPSHLYKLMEITNKTDIELKHMIPMRASPLEWLVEYTGYCVCWYSSCILPIGYSKRQIAVIRRLMRNNIMTSNIIANIAQEKSLCDLWTKFEETNDEEYFQQIQNFERVKPITIRR